MSDTTKLPPGKYAARVLAEDRWAREWHTKEHADKRAASLQAWRDEIKRTGKVLSE